MSEEVENEVRRFLSEIAQTSTHLATSLARYKADKAMLANNSSEPADIALQRRLRLQREVAQPLLVESQSAKFWDQATPAQAYEAWAVAARFDDEYAQECAKNIARRGKEKWGIDFEATTAQASENLPENPVDEPQYTPGQEVSTPGEKMERAEYWLSILEAVEAEAPDLLDFYLDDREEQVELKPSSTNAEVVEQLSADERVDYDRMARRDAWRKRLETQYGIEFARATTTADLGNPVPGKKAIGDQLHQGTSTNVSAQRRAQHVARTATRAR